MNTTKTHSVTFPAVTFQPVLGGVRVRREGKGDTLYVTRDERARSPQTLLIIMHGVGVVGRVGWVHGDWFVERGVFRHWDYDRGVYQVFPSSTVETIWGFDTMTEAVAHEAIWYLT